MSAPPSVSLEYDIDSGSRAVAHRVDSTELESMSEPSASTTRHSLSSSRPVRAKNTSSICGLSCECCEYETVSRRRHHHRRRSPREEGSSNSTGSLDEELSDRSSGQRSASGSSSNSFPMGRSQAMPSEDIPSSLGLKSKANLVVSSSSSPSTFPSGSSSAISPHPATVTTNPGSCSVDIPQKQRIDVAANNLSLIRAALNLRLNEQISTSMPSASPAMSISVSATDAVKATRPPHLPPRESPTTALRSPVRHVAKPGLVGIRRGGVFFPIRPKAVGPSVAHRRSAPIVDEKPKVTGARVTNVSRLTSTIRTLPLPASAKSSTNFYQFSSDRKPSDSPGPYPSSFPHGARPSGDLTNSSASAIRTHPSHSSVKTGSNFEFRSSGSDCKPSVSPAFSSISDAANDRLSGHYSNSSSTTPSVPKVTPGALSPQTHPMAAPSISDSRPTSGSTISPKEAPDSGSMPIQAHQTILVPDSELSRREVHGPAPLLSANSDTKPLNTVHLTTTEEDPHVFLEQDLCLPSSITGVEKLVAPGVLTIPPGSTESHWPTPISVVDSTPSEAARLPFSISNILTLGGASSAAADAASRVRTTAPPPSAPATATSIPPIRRGDESGGSLPSTLIPIRTPPSPRHFHQSWIEKPPSRLPHSHPPLSVGDIPLPPSSSLFKPAEFHGVLLADIVIQSQSPGEEIPAGRILDDNARPAAPSSLLPSIKPPALPSLQEDNRIESACPSLLVEEVLLPPQPVATSTSAIESSKHRHHRESTKSSVEFRTPPSPLLEEEEDLEDHWHSLYSLFQSENPKDKVVPSSSASDSVPPLKQFARLPKPNNNGEGRAERRLPGGMLPKPVSISTCTYSSNLLDASFPLVATTQASQPSAENQADIPAGSSSLASEKTLNNRKMAAVKEKDPTMVANKTDSSSFSKAPPPHSSSPSLLGRCLLAESRPRDPRLESRVPFSSIVDQTAAPLSTDSMMSAVSDSSMADSPSPVSIVCRETSKSSSSIPDPGGRSEEGDRDVKRDSGSSRQNMNSIIRSLPVPLLNQLMTVRQTISLSTLKLLNLPSTSRFSREVQEGQEDWPFSDLSPSLPPSSASNRLTSAAPIPTLPSIKAPPVIPKKVLSDSDSGCARSRPFIFPCSKRSRFSWVDDDHLSSPMLYHPVNIKNIGAPATFSHSDERIAIGQQKPSTSLLELENGPSTLVPNDSRLSTSQSRRHLLTPGGAGEDEEAAKDQGNIFTSIYIENKSPEEPSRLSIDDGKGDRVLSISRPPAAVEGEPRRVTLGYVPCQEESSSIVSQPSASCPSTLLSKASATSAHSSRSLGIVNVTPLSAVMLRKTTSSDSTVKVVASDGAGAPTPSPTTVTVVPPKPRLLKKVINPRPQHRVPLNPNGSRWLDNRDSRVKEVQARPNVVWKEEDARLPTLSSASAGVRVAFKERPSSVKNTNRSCVVAPIADSASHNPPVVARTVATSSNRLPTASSSSISISPESQIRSIQKRHREAACSDRAEANSRVLGEEKGRSQPIQSAPGTVLSEDRPPHFMNESRSPAFEENLSVGTDDTTTHVVAIPSNRLPAASSSSISTDSHVGSKRKRPRKSPSLDRVEVQPIVEKSKLDRDKKGSSHRIPVASDSVPSKHSTPSMRKTRSTDSPDLSAYTGPEDVSRVVARPSRRLLAASVSLSQETSIRAKKRSRREERERTPRRKSPSPSGDEEDDILVPIKLPSLKARMLKPDEPYTERFYDIDKDGNFLGEDVPNMEEWTEKEERSAEDEVVGGVVIDREALRMFEKAQSMSRNALQGPSNGMINFIQFGDAKIPTTYRGAYPKHLNCPDTLFVCQYCFDYFQSEFTCKKHQDPRRARCPSLNHPPGDEVYRDAITGYSVFRVDGAKATAYCRHLCMFSMMWQRDKVIHVDVEKFDFFVLCQYTKERRYEPVGYYSKQHDQADRDGEPNRNLLSFLVIPCFQRRGLGRIMIDFSYRLSFFEGLLTGPETPLSDSGEKSYHSFWMETVVCQMDQLRQQGEQKTTIARLVELTNIKREHLLEAMPKRIKSLRKGLYYPLIPSISKDATMIREKRKHLRIRDENFNPEFVEELRSLRQ